MSYYYAVNVQGASTNSSGDTETDMAQFLTVAEQAPCNIVGLYGAAYNQTSVGGIVLRARRWTTPSTSGSSFTPAKRNTQSPAASTGVVTGPTAGSTATNLLSIGLAQTGGMGGWQALEPDAAIVLRPNGGANGNVDIISIATAATMTFDYTVEFNEG